MIKNYIGEYKKSIKSLETEEKLDMFFYRPIGFFIAKASCFLHLTPSTLSLLGLLSGLIASYFFFKSETSLNLIWATLLFLLSGIFDSSDGQLARMTNQSSKVGLILDGICDSLVTIAVYTACAYPLIKSQGIIYLPLVIVCLYLHSCQCAILDFYHREYLYFGLGQNKDDTYWNPSIFEAKENIYRSSTWIDKSLNHLRLTWITKQQILTTRSEFERESMRDYLKNCTNSQREDFMSSYQKHNRWLLPFWRLIGVNAHTILLIIIMFLGRFDIYLIAFDLIIFNLIIYINSLMQKHEDESFLSELVYKAYAE